MNNMLIKSQDEKMEIYPELISLGVRQPVLVIGEKLKSLMDKYGMTVDDLIKKIGNSYRDNITRIINNEEIPNSKMVDKLVKVYEVEHEYFIDKELENVICVQNGIVVGKYGTNKRAEEVLKEMMTTQERCHTNNETIVFVMPKE